MKMKKWVPELLPLKEYLALCAQQMTHVLREDEDGKLVDFYSPLEGAEALAILRQLWTAQYYAYQEASNAARIIPK